MAKLSDYYRIRSRYLRSVNLERDADNAASLAGYIPTPKAIGVVRQVLDGHLGVSPETAWTLTGVYGTGKSACANFLAALCGPRASDARRAAFRVLRESGSSLSGRTSRSIPDDGLVRAIAVGRREPLGGCLLRALARGAEQFWGNRRGPKPAAMQWAVSAVAKPKSVSEADIPDLFHAVSVASGTGVLLIVDELGKLLEHAARNRGDADLYLLQHLAELPRTSGAPTLVLGLLHQAFSEYSHALTSAERAEWEKIQGRFCDIPFAESADQMLRLVEEAIEDSAPKRIKHSVGTHSKAWHIRLRDKLSDSHVAEVLTPSVLASVYPLHPVTALVLPFLCARFGQNDRSLFSFLASPAPAGFSGFMDQRLVDDIHLPLLRLTEVYDYFLDVQAIGGGSANHGRRWVEIQSIIHDVRGLEPDELEALKAIAVLNLVASAGPLRASEELVLAALMSEVANAEDRGRWRRVLDSLLNRRVITYRTRVDEFRLWQGSDFDIESAVAARVDNDRRSVGEVLTTLSPLTPVVAQRHSYRTGTLRYFECQFATGTELHPSARLPGADGVLLYVLDAVAPPIVPATSDDGRPLVVVHTPADAGLIDTARELSALLDLEKFESVLSTDRVARAEVRNRIEVARRLLDSSLEAGLGREAGRWLGGNPDEHGDSINQSLSRFCDTVYPLTPVLWNELINRRELTSQGARAQRELIAALLTSHDKEDLGLTGNGPEVSMYSSLLRATGIHRLEPGGWTIGPPSESTFTPVWRAMEAFCLEAADDRRRLGDLYDVLSAPPYGLKRGIIPVLIAAFLFDHADDVSIYFEGSFLPVLAPHHFELLVKDPSRFAVKYFMLSGIRAEIFRELEAMLRSGGARVPTGARNATLLTVVRPLVRFATDLPAITKTSKALTSEATAVREALLETREPDSLIFTALPEALGLPALAAGEPLSKPRRERFRRGLLGALRELQQHYQRVLDSCADLLRGAFKVEGEKLREDLRVRAGYLGGKVIEPRLRAVVRAASDSASSDTEWLESLVMVIADRPVASWADDDILSFEMNAAEIGRRFLSLYALQADSLRAAREGFEACRVTLTHANGEYIEELVWISEAERRAIENRAAELVADLHRGTATDHQRQAVLVAMMQSMLRPLAPSDSRSDLGKERMHG